MGRVYETEVICLTKCSKYVIIRPNKYGWSRTSDEEFCKENQLEDESILLDVTDIGKITSNFTHEGGMDETSACHWGVYTIEEFRDFTVLHSKIGYFQLKNLCKKITTEMQIEFNSILENPENWAHPGCQSSYGVVNINPVLARVILDTY